jgi:hypothetical protein
MVDVATRIRIQQGRARLEALGEKLGIQPGNTDYTGSEWQYYMYREVVTKFRADPSLAERPVTELAALFDTSPTTVYRALREIGVEPTTGADGRRRWRSRESSAEVVARHLREHGDDDVSDRELAGRLGVSRTTIRRARRDLGLPSRPPGRPSTSPELDSLVVQMRDADGASFSEVGAVLGLTRQAAHKRYRAAVARSQAGK